MHNISQYIAYNNILPTPFLTEYLQWLLLTLGRGMMYNFKNIITIIDFAKKGFHFILILFYFIGKLLNSYREFIEHK